jgi:hypothetical protein
MATRDEMIAGFAPRIVSRAPRNRPRDAIVRQASVTQLDLDDSAQTRRHELFPRFVEHDLGLTPQHVRSVAKLVGLFYKLLGGRPCCLRPTSHFRWEHRAIVEMGSSTVGQVFTAPGASVRAAGEGVPGKLVESEAPGARNAVRYGVVPAVVNEKCAFFAAEAARQATVKVNNTITVAFDGVFRGEHPQAARTRQLRLPLHSPRSIEG